MFTVHIYVEADSITPRAAKRRTGYVLECITKSGNTRTVEGFSEKTGTYHRAILLTLIEALDRLNQPCEIHMHSHNQYVLSCLGKNLDAWADNGYLTSRGEPVRNREAWERIGNILKNHIYTTQSGTHPYYAWMLSEMAKHSGNPE